MSHSRYYMRDLNGHKVDSIMDFNVAAPQPVTLGVRDQRVRRRTADVPGLPPSAPDQDNPPMEPQRQRTANHLTGVGFVYTPANACPLRPVRHDAAPVPWHLYRWLVFFGLLMFGGFTAFSNGLVDQLIRTDQSYLSASFCVCSSSPVWTPDAARTGWAENCAVPCGWPHWRANQSLFIHDAEKGICFLAADDADFTPTITCCCWPTRRCISAACAARICCWSDSRNALGRGHETGWFLADLMVRLGLPGMVIGFIFMLGSVAHARAWISHALQQLLTNMSDGMRIALYTTLTGLGPASCWASSTDCSTARWTA